MSRRHDGAGGHSRRNRFCGIIVSRTGRESAMKSVFALVLTAGITTAAPATVRVETASGDWKNLPQLNQKGYNHLSEKMQAKLFEIAESKSCPAFALKQGRLDFRVGFAVQYEATGTLARLLLPKLDCAEAESVTGGVLLEMLNSGDYSPTGKSSTGWYQGTLGFSFTGKNAGDPAVVAVPAQPGAVKSANQTEIVCQRIEVLGSRLAVKRVCMSRADWAQRKKDDRDAVDQAQAQRGCKLDTECT
ncbi:MAG: hypothetical protein ABI422_01795 [Sphingomicrobium sp.]